MIDAGSGRGHIPNGVPQPVFETRKNLTVQNLFHFLHTPCQSACLTRAIRADDDEFPESRPLLLSCLTSVAKDCEGSPPSDAERATGNEAVPIRTLICLYRTSSNVWCGRHQAACLAVADKLAPCGELDEGAPTCSGARAIARFLRNAVGIRARDPGGYSLCVIVLCPGAVSGALRDVAVLLGLCRIGKPKHKTPWLCIICTECAAEVSIQCLWRCAFRQITEGDLQLVVLRGLSPSHTFSSVIASIHNPFVRCRLVEITLPWLRIVLPLKNESRYRRETHRNDPKDTHPPRPNGNFSRMLNTK